MDFILRLAVLFTGRSRGATGCNTGFMGSKACGKLPLGVMTPSIAWKIDGRMVTCVFMRKHTNRPECSLWLGCDGTDVRTGVLPTIGEQGS